MRERLAELAMEGAAFEVGLDGRDEPGPAGAETVEFRIAPNPGVPAGPLREIASGGELSRVMLALMGVAAEGLHGSDAAPPPDAPLLVFDEVDAGIGGHTARAVGERLRDLAGGRRVAVHHASAAGRLAGRPPLPRREGHRRRSRPRDGRASCGPTRSWPSSCGCSAPTPATSRRRTRATAKALPQAAGLAPYTSPVAVSGTKREPAAGTTAPLREIQGIARLGKRTKRLVKRLRRGDIAIIDHLDLDRVSAEDLIACGVEAVVNAAHSSSGRYPNAGPLLLVQAGIHLVDAPGAPLFDLLEDGDHDRRPRTARSSATGR